MARSRLLALLVALAAGCSDDPPTIRNLKYTPNAGNLNMMASINGSVDYTDSDDDISQEQFELLSPSGTMSFSPVTPIMNVNQGAIGSVDFTIGLVPDEVGNYTFQVWIIDLKGRQSNRLEGLIRVSP